MLRTEPVVFPVNARQALALLLCVLGLSAGPVDGRADETVVLGGNVWAPFVIPGEERGTAEQLVCTALERAGYTCTVQTDAWEKVLEETQAGAVDGIVAVWRTRERSKFLLFSKPYLTNRIVPVVRTGSGTAISSAADLAGLRVALVAEYAYGDELVESEIRFEEIRLADPLAAMRAVADGRADVALVDELVARHELDGSSVSGVDALPTVLATRDLRFAVARDNPDGERLLDDFQRSFQTMIEDGTVNDILDIDWVASDFGHLGRTDLVLRTGAKLDQVSHPSRDGAVYTLGGSRYDHDSLAGPEEDNRVNYQINGTSHSSLQQAINNVFGQEVGCEHKEFSSEFDCTRLLKK